MVKKYVAKRTGKILMIVKDGRPYDYRAYDVATTIEENPTIIKYINFNKFRDDVKEVEVMELPNKILMANEPFILFEEDEETKTISVKFSEEVELKNMKNISDEELIKIAKEHYSKRKLSAKHHLLFYNALSELLKRKYKVEETIEITKN